MMRRAWYREASAEHVRSRLARAWLSSDEYCDAVPELGEVMLRPHQVDAVSRVKLAFDEFGGALLADEVGLGKTYVALAVARDAQRAVIVAPAALRRMWSDAQAATAMRVPFVSIERLSRSPPPAIATSRYDLVVVDEAHHARNARARRYDALARLAIGARVLLLTATPLHNRRRDLHTLLALFLGDRAATLDDAELARCVVRRDRHAVSAAAAPPLVAPVARVTLAPQDDVLESLLGLPPPLPAADAGDGGALVARTLIRQWSSSIGALRAALRRRIVRAEAMVAALKQGRHPTVDELRAWVVGDDAIQFALDLFAPSVAAPESLLAVVRRHAAAVRSLSARLATSDDVSRTDALRRVRRTHPGVPVVAFSHSADTIRALYALLSRDGGVCALLGSGARVANGGMSREEALDRFAPGARGRSPPREADRITLLLTTDLLSEGVNLQDAGVVVHLDLPWTHARLEQRVGRAARAGSHHPLVHVYQLEMPASAEALLRLEAVLARKRALAITAIGETSGGSPGSPVAAAEALRQMMRLWQRDPASHEDCDERPIAAAVQAAGDSDAALALVRLHDRELLVGVEFATGVVMYDPVVLHALVARAGGDGCALRLAELRRARAIVIRWLIRRTTADALGLDQARSSGIQRTVTRRAAHVLASLSRSDRSAARSNVVRIRQLVRGRLGAGAAQTVEQLLHDPPFDRAWLGRVADALSEVASTPERSPTTGDASLVALLMLQPDRAVPANGGMTAPR